MPHLNGYELCQRNKDAPNPRLVLTPVILMSAPTLDSDIRYAKSLGAKECKQEFRLFRQAQTGCRASLNELMNRHEGLVQAAVRRGLCRGELSYDEAWQAGREGLWRAILKYDPGRGIACSSYGWPSISRRMWLAVQWRERIKGRQEWAQSRLPEPAQEVEPDPAHLEEEAAVKAVLTELI